MSLERRGDLTVPVETNFLPHNTKRIHAISTPAPYTFPVFRHNAMQMAEQQFNLWLKQTSDVVVKRHKTASGEHLRLPTALNLLNPSGNFTYHQL
jgi:hypothetical protein